jgi:hypothetical protein
LVLDMGLPQLCAEAGPKIIVAAISAVDCAAGDSGDEASLYGPITVKAFVLSAVAVSLVLLSAVRDHNGPAHIRLGL